MNAYHGEVDVRKQECVAYDALRTRSHQHFSTTKVNGLSVSVEVTDGLRVLGAPVSSLKFCQAFLLKALFKVQSDADKLLSNLEDLQTTLRLYSMCTANKITHLFSHDVYNTTLDELPDQHWL
jgi:hypothetical protein